MQRLRRRLTSISLTLLLGGVIGAGQVKLVLAEATSAPSLVISQLKITASNGQFVTLYNASNRSLDLSKYQLQYFNNYDSSKATSNRTINLSGSLEPHGYYLLNDSAMLLCYRLSINSLSLGFSSTAGSLKVQAIGAGTSAASVQDFVAWSKTATPGAQTLPSAAGAFLQRQPQDESNNPAVGSPGSGSWQAVQPDPSNACNLITVGAAPTSISPGLTQLLPSSEPPATFASTADVTAMTNQALPPDDVGLMAPEITELLPNPSGTGNDSTDEFIELYNANDSDFDLSGFTLQVGTTSLHSYKFPAGTSLNGKGFTARYSSTTGLSLSNSGGQARLLDPSGNSISSSSVYGTAKDGWAWARADGKWYWTSTPTPGEPNVINNPAALTSGAKSAAATKTAAAKAKAKASVSKSTTKKAKAAKTKKAKKKKPKPRSTGATTEAAAKTPVHTTALVAIAALALLYGAYEYRADAANQFYRLRNHFGLRRGDGEATSGWGGDRADE